jgi:N-sulfoglucosamine sulfohydrolase
MSKPNVLILVPHDLGDFLPAYGTPVDAPNSERLAGEGVVCTNHFSVGTVCSPSRGSLMTGCYPHTTKFMGLVHRGWALDVENFPTIPMRMREAGWQTCLFGGQHEHPQPEKLGYDLVDLPGRKGEKNHIENGVRDAVAWLRSDAAKEKPFYMSIGSGEVHRIGLRPSGWERDCYQYPDPQDVTVPPWLPDTPEIRTELSQFYGSIRHFDHEVGKVLDALDETGLAGNTIVILTTDHGASFIHGKATLYDGGTKIACIWRWPDSLPAGRRCEALTSHIDMMTTLAELCGFDPPERQEGESFVPQLTGEAEAVSGGGREFVFAEKNYTNFYDPTRFARSKEYKYIRKGISTCIFDFQIPEIELSRHDFRSHREVYEFYSGMRCKQEFYDLQADPGELVNLVDDPASAAELARHRAALDAHLEATDDPFRNVVNDLDAQADGYPVVRPVGRQ